MVIFHSYVNLYQRLARKNVSMNNDFHVYECFIHEYDVSSEMGGFPQIFQETSSNIISIIDCRIFGMEPMKSTNHINHPAGLSPHFRIPTGREQIKNHQETTKNLSQLVDLPFMDPFMNLSYLFYSYMWPICIIYRVVDGQI